MRVKYTQHGLERLRERGISKKNVEEAIRTGRKSDAEDNLRKATHRNKKGTLIVIYDVNSPNEIKVITAYLEQ